MNESMETPTWIRKVDEASQLQQSKQSSGHIVTPPEESVLQLSVSSTVRDLFQYPNSTFFSLEFSDNPIFNVKSIVQGDSIIQIAQCDL